MLAVLALSLALAVGSGAELIFTISPEIVEPDFTPYFSLSCSLMDNQRVKVVSITISRQTSHDSNINTAPKEEIASIRAVSPNQPKASPGFQRLTVLGQITTFEHELGTYLNVVWPSPMVDDLGLYTCDATVVGPTGLLNPLTAQVRVTTADPLIDRLLATMEDLEKKIDHFNDTLVNMQDRLDEVESGGQENAEEEVTSEPEHNDETQQETEVESGHDGDASSSHDSHGDHHSHHGRHEDRSLDRLTDAILAISSKLDHVNNSVASIEKRMVELEGADADNDTDTDRHDHHHYDQDKIVHYFVTDNSSYFLVHATQNTDVNTAQFVCESKRLSLLEIKDEVEYKDVTGEILPYVEEGSLVIVGGKQAAGRRDWEWQTSGDRVSYFAWARREPRWSRSSLCMALRKRGGQMNMVSIACSVDHEEIYFICEDPQTKS